MSVDRLWIWRLMASGRINAREAERLLVAASDEDEGILRVAVCGAIAWVVLPHVAEVIHGAVQTASVLLPRLLDGTHQVVACLNGWMGGVR